jgi:hypothetical protein
VPAGVHLLVVRVDECDQHVEQAQPIYLFKKLD